MTKSALDIWPLPRSLPRVPKSDVRVAAMNSCAVILLTELINWQMYDRQAAAKKRVDDAVAFAEAHQNPKLSDGTEIVFSAKSETL